MITISQIVYRAIPESTFMNAQELGVILENCPDIKIAIRLAQTGISFEMDRMQVASNLISRQDASFFVCKDGGGLVFEEVLQ